MNSPQNLIPQGWKRTTLKEGDKVTVVVRPLRDGKPGGSYMSITLADGTKLNGSGPGQRDLTPRLLPPLRPTSPGRPSCGFARSSTAFWPSVVLGRFWLRLGRHSTSGISL